jgi:hypothetical protein
MLSKYKGSGESFIEMSSNIDWHSIILFAEEVFSDGRIRPEGR